jgi:hypothetical protein
LILKIKPLAYLTLEYIVEQRTVKSLDFNSWKRFGENVISDDVKARK